MKDNIIFLGIDGVLNNDISLLTTPDCHIDKFCVDRLLEAIVVIPNLKLVISSSWRAASKERFIYFLHRNKTFPIFEPLLMYLHDDYDTVKIWGEKSIRGDEIKEWVNRHKENINKYLCIDDDSDFYDDQPLLLVDPRRGLGFPETEIIKQFFGVFDYRDTKEQSINYIDALIREEELRLNRRKLLIKGIKIEIK